MKKILFVTFICLTVLCARGVALGADREISMEEVKKLFEILTPSPGYVFGWSDTTLRCWIQDSYPFGTLERYVGEGKNIMCGAYNASGNAEGVFGTTLTGKNAKYDDKLTREQQDNLIFAYIVNLSDRKLNPIYMNKKTGMIELIIKKDGNLISCYGSGCYEE